MEDADREDLQLFRAAASQVRQASVVDQGKRITITGKIVAPGNVMITTELLESEPFRSLAISVRLVYQKNEPSNFGHICAIVERCADDAAKATERKLRADYNRCLERHNVFHVVFLLRHPGAYSPREMFETWLYHGVAHQSRSLKADYDALANLGQVFPYIVQGVVLTLAGRILDLDDIVADVLQQPRVPRIV
jgi:hypothetical protein